FSHLEGIGVTQKVRRMEHIDVEHMTFNPFATIEQTSQLTKLAIHADAKCVLNRMHCAHLIGDRTDTANSGGQIRSFPRVATPEKGFEEAGRLIDLKFYLLNSVALNFHPE